jgi:hypothetical protein
VSGWAGRSISGGGGVDHCLARSDQSEGAQDTPKDRWHQHQFSSPRLSCDSDSVPFRVGAEILSPSSGTAFAFAFDRRLAGAMFVMMEVEGMGREGFKGIWKD